MGKKTRIQSSTEPAVSGIFPPIFPSLPSRKPQTQKRKTGVDRQSSRTIPPVLAREMGKGILNTINIGGNLAFSVL